MNCERSRRTLNSDISSDNVVMASFDVTSLFTNIPAGETIEIICNQIFANRVVFDGLDRSQFIKLLSLAVRNCHFTFNNRIYQQIDDVAMGSPLGPLFANIFMSFHRKTWLHNCPSLFKPLLYRRYVDDCFLLLKSLNHVPHFLDYLKNYPPRFIVNPLSLVFSRISHSFIPLAYQRFLVSCLLHRIFNLCSTYEKFHAQLEVVRKLFNFNGFLSHMFDHLVRRFLYNMFDPKPTVYTVPKKIVFFCLPFTGSHSLQICIQITRLCNAAYPHLNIRFVFRSSTRISSFFPFKDKVPNLMRSRVVYLFKCRCCSASYVSH